MPTKFFGPETTLGAWRLRMAITKLSDTDGDIEFLNRVIKKGKATGSTTKELERAKKRYDRRYKRLSKLSLGDLANVGH